MKKPSKVVERHSEEAGETIIRAHIYPETVGDPTSQNEKNRVIHGTPGRVLRNKLHDL